MPDISPPATVLQHPVSSLSCQPTLFDAASGGGGEIPAGTGFVPLRGLALAAARAPEVDFRNEVQYRDLPCKSLIAPVISERMPFEFQINPYRGCEFGCAYCYARYTHEFMELQEWVDFERRIFVKRAAAEALVRDLRTRDLRGKWIAMGTATDPYQPAERRFLITRSILDILAGRHDLRLSITTKGDLVVRDLDLLRQISRHNDLQVNITITTTDHRLARRIEPRAPRPDRRLLAVRRLSEGGIHTGVFAMPILPRINDGLEALDDLFRRAAEAGAAFVSSQVLFLRQSSRKRFMPFIEQEFPELADYYRRLYSRDRSESLAGYTRTKMEEVDLLRRRHNLRGSTPAPPPQRDQLLLDL